MNYWMVREEKLFNFLIILMIILIEILDFGYPQNSDVGILKTYITQQGVKSQVIFEEYKKTKNLNFLSKFLSQKRKQHR
jgi:AP-2 complex subunit mu-1